MTHSTKCLVFSLFVLLSSCGGYGGYGSGPANAPAPGATVIRWYVGATGVETSVKAGTVVQWQSMDGMAHTVTSSDTPAAFAELQVPGGGLSAPTTFATAGTFPYFCSIHGARQQNGTLTVTP